MKTESDFEKALASLKREPLPPNWKSDMLDRAADIEPDKTIALNPLINRLAFCFIGACWMAIAFFKLTTPVDSTGHDIAEHYGVTQEQIPLIAQHFSTRLRLPIY